MHFWYKFLTYLFYPLANFFLLLRRFKEKAETQNILSFNQLIIDRDAYKIIKEG